MIKGKLESSDKSLEDRFTEDEKRIKVLENSLKIQDLMGQSDDTYAKLEDFVKTVHVFMGDQIKEHTKKDTALMKW